MNASAAADDLDAGSAGRTGVRLDLLVIAGLVVAALLLRLYGLTAQSLWEDEVATWQQARLDLDGLIRATAADNYPPLHNLIVHLSLQVFGDTPWALRFPSVVLGALTVGALYWTGWPVIGRVGALIAALLLCVSSFHLWYSQEARSYALLGLAATLYAGAAVRFALNGGVGSCIGSVAAGAALLYSHPYGALEWGALSLAIAAWRWRQRGVREAARFVTVAAGAALLYLPWALVLFGRARSIGADGFWIPALTPLRLLYYVTVVVNGPPMLLAGAVGALLAVLGVFAGGQRAISPAGARGGSTLPKPAALAILAAWALLPAAAGGVASWLTVPVLIPRYLIGSLPALLLIVGLGYSQLPRNFLGALTGLLVAGAAVAGFLLYGPLDRDDYRDVAAALDGLIQPGDCLAMNPESAKALSYYRPDGFACLGVAEPLGEARFPSPPRRILAVLSTADQARRIDLTPLGTVTETRQFGVTELAILTPR